MNILFYGNCQLYAVLKTLNLPHNYKTFNLICWDSDIVKEDFTNIINKCDIIITQSIGDNYRNVDYLSTSYIIQHKNPNCKLIIFDSCYFDFYYFDLTYKSFNGNSLREPIDYHYNKMIECYNNGYSIEYYIDNVVNNLNLKTYEELERLAENSLSELHNRYVNNKIKYNGNNIHIISIHDYIKLNYKDKLLFYSMNHPTKYIIQFISEEIINILQIKNTINYNIDLLASPKCILYKCISKNVNFDINKHTVLTKDFTNVNEISKLYYDVYQKIGFTTNHDK
jgi:hypothetical protein